MAVFRLYDMSIFFYYAYCLTLCTPDKVQNADIKDDMSVCTGVLAGLRYPKELVKSLMKVEIMQESVIYQDILNEGIEKGKKEGMEESIISVLSARFGNISTNMVDMIHHIRNKSRLNELLKLAATSRTITEFEQKIRTV